MVHPSFESCELTVAGMCRLFALPLDDVHVHVVTESIACEGTTQEEHEIQLSQARFPTLSPILFVINFILV